MLCYIILCYMLCYVMLSYVILCYCILLYSLALRNDAAEHSGEDSGQQGRQGCESDKGSVSRTLYNSKTQHSRTKRWGVKWTRGRRVERESGTVQKVDSQTQHSRAKRWRTRPVKDDSARRVASRSYRSRRCNGQSTGIIHHQTIIA